MQHPARPLYVTLAEVAGIWIAANFGYFAVLPLFGIDLSYNGAPFALAAYFALWVLVAAFIFGDLFRAFLPVDKRPWVYGALSIAYGTLLFGALYLLSTLPITYGKSLVPYSDIIFATPYYFIPKALEVLLQQTLIAALVISLKGAVRNLSAVCLWYAVLFGGSHLVIYALNDAPTPYGLAVTVGAVISSFVFPPLLLKVKGGFVHSYVLHLSFYILAALVLHTWPPPGYSA